MPSLRHDESNREKPAKGIFRRIIAWLIKGAEKDAAARIACSS